MLVALTLSTHYAIPYLIGKGLTEHSARTALAKARIKGEYPAQCGGKVLPISYNKGLFTIERER